MESSDGEGEWVVPSEGTLLFVWDNSFSVLRGKKLRYNMAVHGDT